MELPGASPREGTERRAAGNSARGDIGGAAARAPPVVPTPAPEAVVFRDEGFVSALAHGAEPIGGVTEGATGSFPVPAEGATPDLDIAPPQEEPDVLLRRLGEVGRIPSPSREGRGMVMRMG
jgi:hypothetical protein